jgi:hypothetical protein
VSDALPVDRSRFFYFTRALKYRTNLASFCQDGKYSTLLKVLYYHRRGLEQHWLDFERKVLDAAAPREGASHVSFQLGELFVKFGMIIEARFRIAKDGIVARCP